MERKPAPRTLASLALLLSMCGVALSAPLNKLATASGMHPIWVNAIRMGFSVLFTLPPVLNTRASVAAIVRLPKKEKGLLFLAGAMLAVHFTCWTASLSLANAFVAAAVWSSYSLMAVLGSSIFLREKTPLPALCGILAAVFGVGLCALGAQGAGLGGILLALLAAVSQAVYMLCGRFVRRGLDTLPYTAVVYSLAFCFLLAGSVVLHAPTQEMTPAGVGFAACLALACTLGGHSLQNYALRFFKAPVVATTNLSEVITGPLLVFAIFREAPRWIELVGGGVILIGVAWYLWWEWKTARMPAGVPEGP